MSEKVMQADNAGSSKGILKEVLKGSLIATLFSLLLVLIFSLAARLFQLSDSIIPTVNSVIKGISVFFAVLIAVKNSELGFVKGFLTGVGFVVISTLLFWILSGKFHLSNLLTDILIACGAGMIAGIISVNKKRKL